MFVIPKFTTAIFFKVLSIVADVLGIIGFLLTANRIFLVVFISALIITIIIFLVPLIHRRYFLQKQRVTAIGLYFIVLVLVCIIGLIFWNRPNEIISTGTKKIDTLKDNDGIKIQQMNGDIIKDRATKSVYNNFKDKVIKK